MPRFANPLPIITPVHRQVDPAHRSAAYKLFHNRYHCITAQANLYSKEYLKISGTLTTGDKACDAAMATSSVQIWLTPAAMAVFLNDGATFALIDPTQSVEIYETINEHLQDWKRHLTLELNTTNVPFQDLRWFEALAVEIFQIARGYMGRTRQPTLGLFPQGAVMRGLSKTTPAQRAEALEASRPKEHSLVVESLRKEQQAATVDPATRSKPWLLKRRDPNGRT
jgi:hypothetical protein